MKPWLTVEHDGSGRAWRYLPGAEYWAAIRARETGRAVELWGPSGVAARVYEPDGTDHEPGGVK